MERYHGRQKSTITSSEMEDDSEDEDDDKISQHALVEAGYNSDGLDDELELGQPPQASKDSSIS
jgi:hypothetical protein